MTLLGFKQFQIIYIFVCDSLSFFLFQIRLQRRHRLCLLFQTAHECAGRARTHRLVVARREPHPRMSPSPRPLWPLPHCGRAPATPPHPHHPPPQRNQHAQVASAEKSSSNHGSAQQILLSLPHKLVWQEWDAIIRLKTQISLLYFFLLIKGTYCFLNIR